MSKLITNEDLWREIEEMDLFKDEQSPYHEKAWEFLQKLQDKRSMTGRDIILVSGLLKLATDFAKYEAKIDA